jgi:hypothetical protein
MDGCSRTWHVCIYVVSCIRTPSNRSHVPWWRSDVQAHVLQRLLPLVDGPPCPSVHVHVGKGGMNEGADLR